jgi:hypothetical protein
MHQKYWCKYLFFLLKTYTAPFRIPLSTLLTIWERFFGQIWEIIFFSFSFMSAINLHSWRSPLSPFIFGIKLNQLSEGRWESNIFLWNISVVALCRHCDLISWLMSPRTRKCMQNLKSLHFSISTEPGFSVHLKPLVFIYFIYLFNLLLRKSCKYI